MKKKQENEKEARKPSGKKQENEKEARKSG